MAAYLRVNDLQSRSGRLSVHQDQLQAQRSITSMVSLLPFTAGWTVVNLCVVCFYVCRYISKLESAQTQYISQVNDLKEVSFCISSAVTCTNNSRRGVGFLPLFVCVSVCFSTSYLSAARNTKLSIEMFLDEFWKPIYFGIKRSTIKKKIIAHVGFCPLFKPMDSSSFVLIGYMFKFF